MLRLRETERDERRSELAEAYRADEIMSEQQKQIDDALAGLIAGCRKAASPGTVDIDRLIESQRYDVLLRAQKKHLAQQREMVAAEIERRRERLVEANREAHVLEKLRERQKQRYNEEEGRKEIKMLDEVAGMLKMRERVS